MVERITSPQIPGFLTFTDGRVPDNDTVKQPPRPVTQPVSRRQYVYGWLCAAVFLLAPFTAAFLR